MGRPIPPDRYPITPRRLSRKAVIAGVVCTVLLAVICLSGLVLSMSASGGAKPVGTSSTHPAQSPAAKPSQPPAAKPTRTAAAAQTPTPVPETVTMPDVVGLNAAAAEDQLHRLGLRNLRFVSGDKRYLMVLVLHNWTVTRQSVAAGTRVDKTAPIVLTCVKP